MRHLQFQQTHKEGRTMTMIRKTTLAIAFGIAFALPAQAQEWAGGGISTTDSRNASATLRVTDLNAANRTLTSTSARGTVSSSDRMTQNSFYSTGTLQADSRADSVLDARQASYLNAGLNTGVSNAVSIGDFAFSSARGNIGVNLASGDGNQQINTGALATINDLQFVFGAAAADALAYQDASANDTRNVGVQNSLVVGGSAFHSVSGNIGLNMAAGSNNQQKNVMTMSVTGNGLAEATASALQKSGRNTVSYDPRSEYDELSGSSSIRQLNVNSSVLEGMAFRGASGNIGVNAASGTGNQQANVMSLSVTSGALRAQ